MSGRWILSLPAWLRLPGWAQRALGVNGLVICVESLADGPESFIPLTSLMPHLPKSDAAQRLRERGVRFLFSFWAWLAVMFSTGNQEAGDQNGFC